MKDVRRLPRLDFAAVPWPHRNSLDRTFPKRKFPNVIDLSPRLELGLSVTAEAEDEIPDQTEN